MIAAPDADGEKLEEHHFGIFDVHAVTDESLLRGFSSACPGVTRFVGLPTPSQTRCIIRMPIYIDKVRYSAITGARPTYPTANLFTDISKGTGNSPLPPRFRSRCTLPLLVSPVKYA